MPITYYCPKCWKEIGDQSVCPACGTDIQHLHQDSYEEKLIGALRHPEPTVPVRAAMVLGELRSTAAVPELIEAAMRTKDPYLQEAAAQALGAIGDEKALDCLEQLKQEGAIRVRAAAERALALVGTQTDAKKKEPDC